MAGEQWLIDGYNLLRSLQSRQSKKNPWSCEQLFGCVAQFASFKKLSTLIVLDGVGDDNEWLAYQTDGFRVVFSQKDPADAYIERFLFQQRGKLRMTVVTDDRAIANISRGGGAQVISTVLFAEMLEDCRKGHQETLDKERSRLYGFHRPFEDKLKDL